MRTARGFSAADFAREHDVPDFILQAFQGQPQACEKVAALALNDEIIEEFL